jgi:two-component system response regulator HydG
MVEPETRLLIVDDGREMADTLADGLRDRGYGVVTASSGREALVVLEREHVDALVTDLRMPDLDGLGLLAASRRLAPNRPVIVMTAYGAIDTAIESIRQGAYHYLTKPFKLDELVIYLERALEEGRTRHEAATLKKTLREAWSPAGFVAKSPAMREVLDIVERVAATDAPILLTGETGTGKGRIAKVLHAQSTRAGGPFVTVNCAALPEALLESELFGHLKGAFTGATQERAGLFADAGGGTVFLDEIGEMPTPLQAKLLQVIESRTVRPVGATRERPVDVRIIAATNRDLHDRVRTGFFREDLLYRLEVVPIRLPALRERQEDLPQLAEQFIAAARSRYPASPVEQISREAVAKLLDFRWPGNVRELEHVMERLVLLGRNAEVTVAELPDTITETPSCAGSAFSGDVLPMRELQRRYAGWALQQCGEHRGRTADKLGIDPKTLAKWLSDGPEEPEGGPESGNIAA